MDEFLELLLIVAIIYATECMAWLRSSRPVVRDVLFRFRRSIVTPSRTLQNGRSGLVLVSPLPFDISLRASRFELSLSPRGVFPQTFQALTGPQRPAAPVVALEWERLEKIEVNGSKLRLARGVDVDTGSPILARRLARLLRGLRAASGETEREERIERELARSLDVRRVRRRFARVRVELGDLRWYATTMFLGLFVVLPTLYYTLGVALWWRQLALSLLLLHVVLVWRFARAHRRVYPRLRGERSTKLWLFSLSPLAGLRAPDALARESLSDFHALAVSRAFLSDRAFREFAASAWRDAVFPVEPVVPPESALAVEVEAWFRARAVAAMERFLVSEGVDLNRALEAPRAREAESVAYCPRCEDQFVRVDAVCADCGSRELVPLPPASHAPES